MKQGSELLVYCDGGARGNPGPGASGCVVNNSAGKRRLLCGKYLGSVTNNQAEYEAVSLALEKIKKHFGTTTRIQFFLDSTLVTNQLSGLFKVKNPNLRDQVLKIRGLEASFNEVYYQHIARSENFEADALVNKAIDEKSDFEKLFAE